MIDTVARHCGQRRLGICPQVAAYKVADSAARHGNAGAGHRHGLFCAVAAAVYSGSGRDAHIFGNTARYPGNIGIFAGGKAGYLRLLPALRRFRRNGNGRTIGKERIAAVFNFSDEDQKGYELPVEDAKELEVILASDDETFGGCKKYTKKKVKVTDGKAVLDLSAYSAVYFGI